MKTRPVIRVVTATEAKNRFGDIIKGAYMRDEHLIVKRGGIPVVAIVPIADYEHLVGDDALPEEIAHELEVSARRERAHANLTTLLDRIHARMPEVDEEEAEQEILDVIHEIRAERRRLGD